MTTKKLIGTFLAVTTVIGYFGWFIYAFGWIVMLIGIGVSAVIVAWILLLIWLLG